MGERTSRKASFEIIVIVYTIAFLCGFFIYQVVPGHYLLRILVADICATTLVFIFSCIFGNASVYDPYWSVQPILILFPLAVTDSCLTKKLAYIMILIWGIRLTSNWAYTFKGLDFQDWRYTQLKEKTGKFYFLVNYFGIHMFPTLVVYACILPALFVMYERPAFSSLCLVGFAISIIAVSLQLIADTEMQKYRKNRQTPFIETGLWKYSRHPNYLGEILMWWGVALFTIALLGFRWYFIAGALTNNLMFLFISIPMADRRQAQKPGYEEYAKGKNVLLPIKFR